MAGWLGLWFRRTQTFGHLSSLLAFFYFHALKRKHTSSSSSMHFPFCSASSSSSTHTFEVSSVFLVSLFWHILPPLSLLSGHTHTQTHSGGEVERLVLACHLSSALTLALITASPLANAASLGRRSMCSRHKRSREFAPGNTSSSHYGIRKSVWCDRQFTPAAKRSFCFSLSLPLSLILPLSVVLSRSSRLALESDFWGPSPNNKTKESRRSPAPREAHMNSPDFGFWSLMPTIHYTLLH